MADTNDFEVVAPPADDFEVIKPSGGVASALLRQSAPSASDFEVVTPPPAASILPRRRPLLGGTRSTTAGGPPKALAWDDDLLSTPVSDLQGLAKKYLTTENIQKVGSQFIAGVVGPPGRPADISPSIIPKPAAAFASGAVQNVAGTVDWFTSPNGMLSVMPFAAAPKWAIRLFGAGMLANAVKNTPDAVNQVSEQLAKPPAERDWQKVGDTSANIFTQYLFGLSMAARPGIAKDIPKLGDLLTKSITEEYTPAQMRDIYTRVNSGDPKATQQEKDLVVFINSQIESPSQAIRKGVTVTSTQPRVQSEFWRKYLGLPEGTRTATVPGEPTGGQDASNVEEAAPGDSDSRTSPRQIVSPKPGDFENVTQADARVRGDEGKGTAAPPVEAPAPETPSDVIKRVSAMTPQQFAAAFPMGPNNLTQSAYRLGLSLTTPAQLQELQDAGKNPVTPFHNQFFREAYEAATGTGSAGKYLRENQPGYVPPMPVSEPAKPSAPAQEGVTPVPDGFTRVYRGEGTPNQAKLPEWAKANAGQWFSTSEKKAKDFQAMRGGKLITVDVPTSELEQFKAPSGNAPDEYLIPQETVKNLQNPIPPPSPSVVKPEAEPVSAAIQPKKGAMVTGQAHDQIKAMFPKVKGVEGFMLADGKFITRKEAKKIYGRDHSHEFEFGKEINALYDQAKEVGYPDGKSFERDWKLNSDMPVKETREEFLSRRHCSETVPKKRGLSDE